MESVKQSVIGASIMEAKFVAYYEAMIHALWLQNFISRLGVVDTITKPLKIYCDNSVAIFFSKNDKYSRGAKHMELKYFVVKKEVHKHRVCIEHIRMDLMIANLLTKGLQPKTFKDHVHRMRCSLSMREPRYPLPEIHSEGMIVSEAFQVVAIIEKLPPTWKVLRSNPRLGERGGTQHGIETPLPDLLTLVGPFRNITECIRI